MKHFNKCRSCWWGILRDRQKLTQWLAETLGAEFAYAWARRDELGREEPRAFAYLHPEEARRWLEKGPCESCPCKAHCDEICALRASWWDARMAKLRERL